MLNAAKIFGGVGRSRDELFDAIYDGMRSEK